MRKALILGTFVMRCALMERSRVSQPSLVVGGKVKGWFLMTSI